MVEEDTIRMRTLSRGEVLDWLQLSRTPGLGSAACLALVRRSGSATAALRWLGTPEGLARARVERLARRQSVEDELLRTEDMGGRIVTIEEPEYSGVLRHISDPPAVVSLLGRVELLTDPSIAIVGARNASGNGCRFARDLAMGVSDAGFSIASGLARGIDTAAHEGGLAGSGSTIAVIASGIDIAYPAENKALMQCVAEHGLVLSERPLGAPPLARHFPRRNRIIAGLSQAVVVVEAAEKSGSLMTARLALDQGREVMAVPGSPMDQRHRGTNQLIRDGAQMVESVADIVENLPPSSAPAPRKRREVRSPNPSDRNRTVKPQSKAVPTSMVDVTVGEVRTSDDEGSVAQATLAERMERMLGPEPLAVDELIRQCHATAAQVQSALLNLELDGRLVRHSGNRVSLAID